MFGDLKIFSDLARGTFPKKAPLKGIGKEFYINDIKAFNDAKFSVRKLDGNGSSNSSIASIDLEEGDILTYVGRGSGNKKMYRFDTADGEIFHIHMSWKADGKPESFGLKEYEDAAKPTNPVKPPEFNAK